MSDNFNDPAFPCQNQYGDHLEGMTKREYAIIKFVAAQIANEGTDGDWQAENHVNRAVYYADILFGE